MIQQKSKKTKYLFKVSVASLLVIFFIGNLSACGWRLRGGLTLPDGLTLVHVTTTDPSSTFERNLTQLLQANGVTTVSQSSDAQITISTGKLEETRRVVSTGGNTLVTEYELESTIPFSVEDSAGNILISTETARTSRTYAFDQNDIVGKAQEERLIQSEMQRELVQQIVRRLRFIDTNTSSGANSSSTPATNTPTKNNSSTE